ncbi:hypothetical protein ACOMHN_045787 [Nucella lapillus]
MTITCLQCLGTISFSPCRRPAAPPPTHPACQTDDRKRDQWLQNACRSTNQPASRPVREGGYELVVLNASLSPQASSIIRESPCPHTTAKGSPGGDTSPDD